MKKLLLATTVTATLLIGACGNDETAICHTTTQGKLCDDKGAAYCEEIGYPTGESNTDLFCEKLTRAGYGDNGKESKEEVCGVTLSGNKLCGEDARAYCSLIEGYDPDSASYESCKEILDSKYDKETNEALDELLDQL